MHEIFISYRRSDTEAVVERLYERLIRHFGEDHIFRDKQSIEAGADFPDVLSEALQQCKVMLVMIGSQWLKAQDDYGRRRLDDANDWVRREVEVGLTDDRIRVIPILVDNMPMPPTDALPDSLQSLSRKNALVLRHDPDFSTDVDRIVTALTKATKLAAQPLLPSAEQAQQQAVHALQDATDSVNAPTTTRKTRRVGSFPDYFDNTRDFHNRTTYIPEIRSQISNQARVLVVLGKSGIGKTALVCKVLGDIEQDTDLLDGIISISGKTVEGQPNPITLERIISDMQKLLPEADINIQETDTARQVEAILNITEQGRYVLLLDNFELLQDPQNGICTSPELETLLLATLRRGSLTIIITTQIPLSLRDRTHKGMLRLIPLTDGLPEAESLVFINSLLVDVLVAPSDDELRPLINLTHGHPRALAAAAGWLSDNPLNPVSDLIDEIQLQEGEVTYHLVGAAFESLSPAMRRVIETLALFPDDVATSPALAYMLAPFLDMESTPLSRVLNALVTRRIVTYDPSNRTLDLHTTDRRYALRQLPDNWNDEATYGRYALLRRAADFYANERKPKSAWHNRDDVLPQLHEFEFRYQLGEYDTAAALLIEMDFDYLFIWGHVKEVIGLNERLLGKISNLNLAGISVSNLGSAYRRRAQPEKSIQMYERAIDLARQEGNVKAEGQWLARLGSSYSDLGDINQMIEHYEQALPISRQVDDERGEATILGDLGIAYRLLGDMPKALDYHNQALAISERLAKSDVQGIQRGGKRGQSNQLANIGLTHAYLGAWEQATSFTEQAIAISRDINYRRGEGIRIGNLGWILAQQGEIERGLAMLKQSIEIAEDVGDPYYRATKALQLAEIHLINGDPMAIWDVMEPVSSTSILQLNPLIHVALGVGALVNGNKDEARKHFNSTIQHAKIILDKTEQFFTARYAMGLAQAGLVVTGDGTLQRASSTYKVAYANCSARGILADQRRWLDTVIAQGDPVHLETLRQIITQ